MGHIEKFHLAVNAEINFFQFTQQAAYFAPFFTPFNCIRFTLFFTPFNYIRKVFFKKSADRTAELRSGFAPFPFFTIKYRCDVQLVGGGKVRAGDHHAVARASTLQRLELHGINLGVEYAACGAYGVYGIVDQTVFPLLHTQAKAFTLVKLEQPRFRVAGQIVAQLRKGFLIYRVGTANAAGKAKALGAGQCFHQRDRSGDAHDAHIIHQRSDVTHGCTFSHPFPCVGSSLKNHRFWSFPLVKVFSSVSAILAIFQRLSLGSPLRSSSK